MRTLRCADRRRRRRGPASAGRGFLTQEAHVCRQAECLRRAGFRLFEVSARCRLGYIRRTTDDAGVMSGASPRESSLAPPLGSPCRQQLVLARQQVHELLKAFLVLASAFDYHQLVPISIRRETCLTRPLLSPKMKEPDHGDLRRTSTFVGHVMLCNNMACVCASPPFLHIVGGRGHPRGEDLRSAGRAHDNCSGTEHGITTTARQTLMQAT
jgi:hypothetical protein